MCTRTAALLAALILPISEVKSQPYQWNSIAITGELAPGVPDNAHYSNLSNFSINSHGDVAFVAQLDGDSVNPQYRHAIFRGSSDTGMVPVAREGEHAHGHPDDILYDYLDQSIITYYPQKLFNDSGDLVFRGITTAGEALMYAAGSGDTFSIAEKGAQAAGLADGVTYRRFSVSSPNTSPHLTNNSTVVYQAELFGTGVNSNNDMGVFRYAPNGDTVSILQTGDTAIGSSGDTRVAGVEALDVDPNGRISMLVTLQGPALTYNRALYIEDSAQNMTVVAQQNSQVPTLPTGTYFGPFLNSFSIRALDETRTVFHSYIYGKDIDSSNNSALFQHDINNGLSIIARAGDFVPGSNDGYLYSFIDPLSLVNSSDGHTTFQAGITADDSSGSFHRALISDYSDNGHMVVAKTGDQVPGLADGIVYHSFDNAFANSNSSLVFMANILDGAESTPALFHTDASNETSLIAKIGDMVDVDNDPDTFDFRTLSFMRPLDLTDGNQVALIAAFEDGSFGYLSVTVPCPSSSLALLSLPFLATRRRSTSSFRG